MNKQSAPSADKTLVVRQLRLGEGRPKICVPLVAKTLEELWQQAAQAQAAKAEIWELRGDWLAGAEAVETHLKALDMLRGVAGEKPLLYTYRPAAKELAQPQFAAQYTQLARAVAGQQLADLIDLDMAIGEEHLRQLAQDMHKESIRVVASRHYFESTPPQQEMVETLLALRRLGGDVAKLAVWAATPRHTARLLVAAAEYSACPQSGPFCVMAMGQAGQISRYAAGAFGSCITFGRLALASAPGQPDVETLAAALGMLYPEEGQGET